MNGNQDWRVYTGTGQPRSAPIDNLPKAPPWRQFTGAGHVEQRPVDDGGETTRRIGQAANRRHLSTSHEVAMVNAAIYLRRPLLVTGRPGTGKSSLAYLIASELGLGPVLRWSIGSRTVLQDGLYSYDAIGRVQAANARPHDEPDIGEFIHLGPLGTPPDRDPSTAWHIAAGATPELSAEARMWPPGRATRNHCRDDRQSNSSLQPDTLLDRII